MELPAIDSVLAGCSLSTLCPTVVKLVILLCIG